MEEGMMGSPMVNFFITELLALLAGHRTLEAQL
jgi:hypothetical protein